MASFGLVERVHMATGSPATFTLVIEELGVGIRRCLDLSAPGQLDNGPTAVIELNQDAVAATALGDYRDITPRERVELIELRKEFERVLCEDRGPSVALKPGVGKRIRKLGHYRVRRPVSHHSR